MSLRDLLNEQRAMAAENDHKLGSYFEKGRDSRPWDGLWVVVPIHPSKPVPPSVVTSHTASEASSSSAPKHRISRPEHSYVFLREVPGSVIEGTWWDGEQRYDISGSIAASGKAIDGARLTDSVTNKLLTPACFRAGYNAQSIEVRFEWAFASPEPPRDAVRLSRLDRPRIVAVSVSSDKAEDSTQLARRLCTTRPLHIQTAPVVATAAEAAKRYLMPEAVAESSSTAAEDPTRVPAMRVVSPEDFDEGIARAAYMTWGSAAQDNTNLNAATSGARSAIDAVGCHRILASSAKLLLIAASVDDVVRLREWNAPCAFAQVALKRTGADDDDRQGALVQAPRAARSVGSRVVDGFTCYDLAADTVEDAAQMLVQTLLR